MGETEGTMAKTGPRPLALLAAVITLAVGGGSVAAAAQAPQDYTEPPLELTLTAKGRSYAVELGKPFEFETPAGPQSWLLRARPDRRFAYGGVEFRYPDGYSFEADAESPDVTIWTLDGNDAVIMFYRFRGRTDVEELRGRFIANMTEQHGPSNVKESESSIRLDGKDIVGRRLELSIATSRLIQDIYAFGSEGSVCLLVLQGTLGDDGQTSREFAETKELLQKTFRSPASTRPGQRSGAAKKPKKYAEPALEITLETGDGAYDVELDKPFEIGQASRKQKLLLSAKPDRLFRYGGVEFRYPRDFGFEADAEDPSITIWTLDGNDAVIILNLFPGRKDADEVLRQFIEQVSERYGRPNIRASDVSIRLDGADIAGRRLDVTLAAGQFRQEFYVFSGENDVYVLGLQDGLEDDGSPSQEFLKTTDLLKRTFRRTEPPESAPTNTPADTVEIPFPSKVGDRARYAVCYIKKGFSGESTATTDVTVEITRADKAGSLVTWTFGKFGAGSVGRDAGIEDQRIVDLMRSVRLILEIDPAATPTDLKLTNWEELQARLAQGFEGLRERMSAGGMDQAAVERMASFLGPFYRDRDVMTAYYTKEATLFFSLLGKRIRVSRPLEYKTQLQNPFGGDPIPGAWRLSVKSYDPAAGKAVVLITGTLDPATAPQILEKFTRDIIAKFAPEFSKEAAEGLSVKSFSLDGETELGIDLASGWPDSLTYKARMTAEMAVPGEASSVPVTQEETISMTRTEGEAPPEVKRADVGWRALFKEAKGFGAKEQWERALEAGERALRLAERDIGPDHPDLCPILEGLAELRIGDGDPQEAEPLYKRSLAIKERAFGPDHPVVAESLDNLAAYYEDLGQDAKAVTAYERLLAIREKSSGPEHPQVATVLDKIARLYYYQRRYADAEPVWRRSLAIREKVLGPAHLDVATNLRDLAMLFQVQGKYSAAEPLWKRSLAIQEKVLGADHPDSITTRSFLAELYRATNREKEAEELERRAARIPPIKR
jgi:tetratricopeptide (TPR) repeat protein